MLAGSLIAGCAGAPGSATPSLSQPNGNGTSIAAMIAQAQADTQAIKAQLQGHGSIVNTSGGAMLYLDGKLVDTVGYHKDGSMTHAFANGTTATSPALFPSGIRPMNNVEPNAAVCDDLSALIGVDQTKLDWAALSVILAVGATLASALFTLGILTVPAGTVAAGVIAIWVADKAALDGAELAYANNGC